MKSFLTLAAAAAVALTAGPALADKGGHGHGGGNDHGNGGQEWKHGGGDRDDDRGRWAERREDHRDYGYHNSGYRHCPPGLAKRHNGCMAPGHYRRWAQGSRLPYGYNSYTPYNQLPQRYIDQYGLDSNNRYIYRDNTIYQVDPRTSIIQRILGGLVR